MATTKAQLKVHTSEELQDIIVCYVTALQKHIRVYAGTYA
jgi:hypothetical protein